MTSGLDQAGADASLASFCAALAEDIDALARFHDRELDPIAIAALLSERFPDGLALMPDTESAVRAWALMGEAVGELGGDGRSLEPLAADFAGIFLNGSFGASPYESVWLHDEHLACQFPMFELRSLYRGCGLAVGDWRKRYDDHLVLQFQFFAHRLRATADVECLAETGRLLDCHVGYWYPDFAARVAGRCDTAFYRALVLLTAEWLARFRSMIAEISGEPRRSRESITDEIRAKIARETGELAPVRFMPGVTGPGW